MKHIDLFSGIGGFALAADRVWDDVEHTFCDIEPFSQLVLTKHWHNSKIYGDIRTLTADTHFNRQPRLDSQEHTTKGGEQALDGITGRTSETIDILTGGFPCQPFSQAGRRRGTEDDRYLWPEMLRVIREFNPRWVIGENVGGLVTWSEGMVLEQVHADLEAEGYEVQAFIIPACAVNAPHRRDRVWIVANKLDSRLERGSEQAKGYSGLSSGEWSNEGRNSWEQNWLEVATRLCRVDDGIPRRMDRNPRLKALGNAIVPQVAEEIFRAIKEVDNL